MEQHPLNRIFDELIDKHSEAISSTEHAAVSIKAMAKVIESLVEMNPTVSDIREIANDFEAYVSMLENQN